MKIFFSILCIFTGNFVAFSQTRTLDFYISEATVNSPLRTEYQKQVRLTQLDSLLLLAAVRPQVSFVSNNYYAPVTKGYGYDEVITNIANLSALVRVEKPLFNNRSNALQLAGLRLVYDSLKNNAVISEQDLIKIITGQYITVYGDLLQLNYGNDIQIILTKQEAVLKKLTQNNVYKQVDYLAFYITLQQNEFKIKQQTYQYQNDYATLNYLAGITDTSQPILDSPEIVLKTIRDFNESVFSKRFEIDSLTLLNRRSMVALSYRTRVSAFADAGYNSSLRYRPYKNWGSSVGVSLVVPIYDGKQKRLQYEKIATEQNSLSLNRKYFNNQYQQQLTQLNRQLTSLTGLESDINLQLKYLETLINVNGKLLQTGDIRIYDYILVLNNYINAKSMLTDNKISKLQLINQVNYWSR